MNLSTKEREAYAKQRIAGSPLRVNEVMPKRAAEHPSILQTTSETLPSIEEFTKDDYLFLESNLKMVGAKHNATSESDTNS